MKHKCYISYKFEDEYYRNKIVAKLEEKFSLSQEASEEYVEKWFLPAK